MFRKSVRRSLMCALTGAFLMTGLALNSTAMANEHASANTLTDVEKAAGWTLLFDGKSTEHWRGYQKDGFPTQGWSIDGDAIKVHQGGGGGDIITVQKYEDFELSLEWKASEGGNSGIMYRVTEEYSTPWQSGPEAQILDDKGGNVEPLHKWAAGSLYDLVPPDPKKISKPAGEYNTARIRMRRGVVQHFLNGVKVVEMDLNSDEWKEMVANSKFAPYPGFGVNAKGHLCLQDHGNDIWFRNIKIRDLNAQPKGEKQLLKPGSFDGWTTFYRNDEKGEGTFAFDGDVMVCKGQPIGYIRTTDKHTNYILRLEWRFDPAKGAGNSGVLLRMIGEDKVWPNSVEAQLHSGSAGDFWNIGEYAMKVAEDRTRGRNTKKMTDGAEHDLGVWNEYEIIVNDGDVILWVNGEKMNHAWDVAENAGYICLQSEGAEIHFRNVRITPLD